MGSCADLPAVGRLIGGVVPAAVDDGVLVGRALISEAPAGGDDVASGEAVGVEDASGVDGCDVDELDLGGAGTSCVEVAG